MRPIAAVLIMLAAAADSRAQRGKETARDLFYSEAGLIVNPRDTRRGKFSAAKKSLIAVTLGLKYRVWKVQDDKPLDWDPNGPWSPGDSIRLGLEINDAGYLYVVHRQPNGLWRRLFPTPEIDRGSHFVRAGVTYPLPPDEALPLTFRNGPERLFVVLSREPVRDLDSLVGPLAPENTVSAAPPPEIPDEIVEKVRTTLNTRDLVVERAAGEKSVYAVNRTGRPESLIAIELRFQPR